MSLAALQRIALSLLNPDSLKSPTTQARTYLWQDFRQERFLKTAILEKFRLQIQLFWICFVCCSADIYALLIELVCHRNGELLSRLPFPLLCAPCFLHGYVYSLEFL